MPLGSVTLVRARQPLNAQMPMVVILFGSEMLANRTQLLKA